MYHSRMQILPKIDKWSQLRAENNPLHATTFLDSLLPPETRRDTSNRFRQMECQPKGSSTKVGKS